MLEGKSEKQDGGKVQWKVLWDMPGFDWRGNKTPWELGMAYSTWRRQFCTVARTVGSRFQLYVEKCFVDAERRYQQKSRDETQNPLTGYDAFPNDYEGRFVAQLLKVLPDRVKSPAMEMSAATTITQPLLLKSWLDRSNRADVRNRQASHVSSDRWSRWRRRPRASMCCVGGV